MTPEQLAARLFTGCEGINVGGRYVHKKSGMDYMVLTLTLRESDLEPMIVYVPCDAARLGYSLSFVRPASEFRDKFEESPL